MSHLIYHPKREVTKYGKLIVYHDKTTHNQDPYVWNASFLHSYCHITQMSPEVGDINFWVSGDTFPEFTKLYCDLVFVVGQKVYWKEANSISPRNSMVESAEAYNDHYKWAKYEHLLKRRRRFTLKADPTLSFQPQTGEGELLNIVPVLAELGFTLEALREGMRAGRGARPFKLSPPVASDLADWLKRNASIHHRGKALARIRATHSELASPSPRRTGGCS